MNSLLISMCFANAKLKPDGKNFSARCAFSLNKRISGHLNSTFS